jgi:hypothetical protein
LDCLPDNFPDFNCLADNVGNPFCVSGLDTFSFIIFGRILDLYKIQKLKSKK